MREVILKAKWVEHPSCLGTHYELVVPSTSGGRQIANIWEALRTIRGQGVLGYVDSHEQLIPYPSALEGMKAIEARLGATPAEPERE